jgi:NADPH-dependent ferric siderophore reductase
MSKLLDHFLVRATVDAVDHVTPRMRRIRLTGPDGLSWTPGQHVRVHVGDLRLRSYSIWDRTDGGHLDLCVLDHPGDGPGARWARDVRVGQPVSFTRPQGRLVPREGPYHLFVGDETAGVAFGAILRALPPSVPTYTLVEVDDPSDRMDLPGEVRWVPRPGLLAGLSALDLPGHPGTAYVAGEARACQAVRRHLVSERGWPRSAVVVKPFWTPGRRGLD